MPGLTINDPVTLDAAIHSENILPGDIIQLADGIYQGDFVVWEAVSGTAARPVKIMPRHPGKVVIDGSLLVIGSYVEIYDIDFTNSNPDRHLLTNSIELISPGVGLYGCSATDLHNNGVRWTQLGPGEICENIIYNNGYRIADGSGHGHAVYGVNTLGGLKTIARNLFYEQFGRYSIHLYTEGDKALKDFHCVDNIIAGHPVHSGGGQGQSNFAYEGNIQYGEWCQLGRYSAPGTNKDITIRNNKFIQLNFQVLRLDDWQTVISEGNEVYDCPAWDWSNPLYSVGFTDMPLPTVLTHIIPFSKSKRWLGAVAIFNRDSAEWVNVDFSSLLVPGSYRLRNGQNINETWEFEYAGGSVNVPTGWTSAARHGDDATVPTWPVFGGLVVETTG